MLSPWNDDVIMTVRRWGAGRYIEERSFRRFAEVCLEKTVVVYVDHLLMQVGNFLEASQRVWRTIHHEVCCGDGRLT